MKTLVLPLLLCLPAVSQDARPILEQAVKHFKAGRIAESVSGFDQATKLQPEAAPHLWQRGIALYYAERYKDCREQFESHRTVNPNDVENAAWHFMCVARQSNEAKAKRALLPVGPDSRAPMKEIYAMFQGGMSPDAVIRSAGTDWTAQFYAHLYAGLFYDAIGKTSEALRQIRLAAQDKYADHGGYMHDVALVHLAVRDSEVWTFDRISRLGKHKTTVKGDPRVIETPEGKAVQFDGVDDAIFVDVHPLAGAATFTWEVIFRPDAGGGREQRFFHLQETGADTRLLFETRLTGNSWYLDSYAHSPTGNKTLVRPDKLHPVGQWYHAAMVYDGKQFRHYVNGALEASADVNLAPQGAGRTSVGVRINLVDYFKGAIRKSRFTRRALKPEEFMR